MRIFYPAKLAMGAAAALLLLCASSCKDEKETSYAPYDPNQPITLTDFYPTSGGVATKLILNGSNFGNDADKVKVFVNEKEAAVIEKLCDAFKNSEKIQPDNYRRIRLSRAGICRTQRLTQNTGQWKGVGRKWLFSEI